MDRNAQKQYNKQAMKAKVLIILPSDKFLHRQILEGILAYGSKRGPWQFHFETGDRYEQGLGKGRRWGCTGIIAMVREAKQLAELIGTKIPAVFINPPVMKNAKGRKPPQWATFVTRDQENVGTTAAEYFLSRGYRNFAFVGTPCSEPAEWCERRLYGFRRRLLGEGLNCFSFSASSPEVASDFDKESIELIAWLKSLPPQTALYAPWDRRALQIIGLCLDAGISVPGSIAILGTDNDEVLCESVSPSLSSIALDGCTAGTLCAQLLDAHMRGLKVEPLVDLAFPRIATRQSTDEMQVPDAFLAKALALVRKDLSVTHTIAELASAVGISKRTLEMKANLILGTTLKAEIDRIRLNEAVRLISNTNMSMQSIAERCGFCCASHLNTRFKTIFGHNPSVFRYQPPK
ncbi:MAG: helix-turn-helix domain-containing protein [Lentisphaerae bacterium]|nr:helix-turn-helix domain-containing protein [Lentisphaerota bacterium]